MKKVYWIPVILNLVLTITCQAQTHLATRGKEQLLRGDTLFTMQDETDYRVIGVSAYQGVYIETSIGAVEFRNAERFRVLPGGTFAEDVTAILQDVESGVINRPGVSNEEARLLNRGRAISSIYPTPFYGASYEAKLIFPRAVGHVYVAFQWSVDDKPVQTDVHTIGKVAANEPIPISFKRSLDPSQPPGTYSIHVYAGYLEIKCIEVTKKQSDSTSIKLKSDGW